ncbi:hypothetical protein FQA39_LY15621 [Lamprigera yunnana]|nr:hypothetical protein FQA39_LY15621 [Lamprigera yunnana]
MQPYIHSILEVGNDDHRQPHQNSTLPSTSRLNDHIQKEHLTPGDSDKDPTEPSARKQKQQHRDLTPDACDNNQTGPSSYYQPQSPRPETPMTPVTDNHPQRKTKTVDQQADTTGKNKQKEATKTSKANDDQIRTENHMLQH